MRGFTIVELILASLFGVLLVGAATASVVRESQGSGVLVQEDVSSLYVEDAMETIAEEIGMASLVGEDRDGNGELGSTEDLNLNETLDSDWSLADGTSATAITFNRRMDLWFGSSARPSTAYSSAIRYRLAGGRILRETTHTATGRTLRTILAHEVQSLRFTRRGRLVHVDIIIRLRDGQTRTLARSVIVRD